LPVAQAATPHAAPATTAAVTAAPIAPGGPRAIAGPPQQRGDHPSVVAEPPPASGAGQPPAVPGRAPEGPRDLLEAAQASWDRLLAAAGKRCGMKVPAALRSVKQIDVSGDVLILRFSHAFGRDLVNQSDNRTQLGAAWSELLGRPVLVRCLLGDEGIPVSREVGGQPAPGQAAAATPVRTDGPAADDPDNSGEDVLLRGARALGAVITRLEDEP
jgi:hypothetical protein